MKQLVFKPGSVHNAQYIIVPGIFAITGFCANAQTTGNLPKTAKEFKNSTMLYLNKLTRFFLCVLFFTLTFH
jgi:hypothetical protein